MAICNEKALCGLGRDMADDGSLNPAAVADALATLTRFRIMLRAYDDPPTQTIATAAVRDAKDGKKFVEAVRRVGYDIRVLTGAEEAEFAALGVASVEPGAKGLVGDMGGGSLELIAMNNGKFTEGVSLPIGPLSIMRSVGSDPVAAQREIDNALKGVSFLKNTKSKTLYTVGGAWRSVAKIHMSLKHYPLSVLHHYEMSFESALEVCDLVARQSRRSLEEIPGISRRRIDTLPFAALALRSLLKEMKAERMVVSAGGIREGLLYSELSNMQRKEDPLWAASRFFSARFSPNAKFGQAALSVIKPLFQDMPAVSLRNLSAVAELVDIAAFAHPDLRGRHAFDTALSAPFVGLSHKDRVWIALALYCRYRGRNAALPNEQAISLLDWDEQQSATQVGLALRFAATLAPKTPELLDGCSLSKTKDGILFSAPAEHENLFGDMPRKRLDNLASAFETTAVLNFI